MTDCNQTDIIGYMEGIDPGGATARHLADCPACRQALRRFQWVMKLVAEGGNQRGAKKKGPLSSIPPDADSSDRLEAELTALGQRSLREMAALPPAINAEIDAIRELHQRRQVEKVLDLQGIKDRHARDEAARRMMADAPEDLPKAAFPDDLADDEDEDA